MTQLKGKIDKGWGYELIWTTGDLYSGKKLHFSKKGNKFSMHYHIKKDETWIVDAGSFLLRYIDPKTAEIKEAILKPNDVWHNPPGLAHQLEALEDSSEITEVSTPDSVEDNFRVFPGDSQL